MLHSTLNSLEGKTVTGNSLVLTLQLGPAVPGPSGARGLSAAPSSRSTVQTGKVLVMATSPTYNPNLVEHHFDRIANTKAPCFSAAAPLVNRATTGLYQPGSTFKLVTAAAALDSGTFTPESRFNDPGYCVEYGKPVLNFADQSGPERFGNVSLAEGLQHSINSVFCNVGIKLGAKKILDYSKKFGFYSHPPLETPGDEQSASGLYDKGRLFYPQHDYQVDPGRLAFGQERLASRHCRWRWSRPRSATAASSCSPTSSTGSSSPEEECCRPRSRSPADARSRPRRQPS